MVEQRGVEPLTSALRTRRSAKLSYCPTRKLDIKGAIWGVSRGSRQQEKVVSGRWSVVRRRARRRGHWNADRPLRPMGGITVKFQIDLTVEFVVELTVKFPEFDCVVHAGGGQGLAVGRKGDRVDFAEMLG
jgi:hypothetical protein